MTTMLKGVPVADATIGTVMTVNSVRLAPALEARLAEMAGRLRMSKSDVIRQALGEFLGRHEVGEQSAANWEAFFDGPRLSEALFDRPRVSDDLGRAEPAVARVREGL